MHMLGGGCQVVVVVLLSTQAARINNKLKSFDCCFKILHDIHEVHL